MAEDSESQENTVEEIALPKVLGKIELQEEYEKFRIPEEFHITKEIKFFGRDGRDVSIKGVVDSLVKRGFDKRLLYSLVNLMVDKHILELYTYKNEKDFDIRGVKIIQPN